MKFMQFLRILAVYKTPLSSLNKKEGILLPNWLQTTTALSYLVVQKYQVENGVNSF